MTVKSGEGARLVDVTNRKELEAWLRTQPVNVSVVLAARAVLRILPFMWAARDAPEFTSNIVLPFFRGMALAWVTARYPTQEAQIDYDTNDRVAVKDGIDAYVLANNLSVRAIIIATTADAADYTDAIADAVNGAAYASMTPRDASFSARVTAEAVKDARLVYESYYDTRYAAHIATDTAANTDIKVLEGGHNAVKLAGNKLWPGRRPAEINKLWAAMKKYLLAQDQDWEVWTNWYDARLAGKPTIKNLEIGRTKITDLFWDQGPAVVNAEIKRLIEEYNKPQDSKPDTQKTPSIPSVRPAAIMPVWRAEKLTINQTALIAEATPETIETALLALHVEMLDLLEDLEAGTNVDPWFLKKLRQLSELAATTHPTQFELFRLAHGQEIFVGYSSSVNEQWPEFLASRFHALNLHFSRCIDKFPQWKAFVSTAREIELTEEQVKDLPALVEGTVKALRDTEATIFIDDSLPAALETLVEPLVENDETRKDVISSVNNILKSVVEPVLKALPIETVKKAGKEYKKHATKSIIKEAGIWGDKTGPAMTAWVKKWLKRGGVGTVSAGTAHIAFSQIIHKFPEIAEWLRMIDPFL